MYSTRNLYRMAIKSTLAIMFFCGVISEVNHNHSNNIEEKTEKVVSNATLSNQNVKSISELRDCNLTAGVSNVNARIISNANLSVNIPVAGASIKPMNYIRKAYTYKRGNDASIDEANIKKKLNDRVSDESIGTGDIIEAVQDEELYKVINSPYNVPNGSLGCKSYNFTYMGYRAVTARSSPQYKLLNSADCWTDPETGLRMYKDRVCIAVGTGYAREIGTEVDLVLDNGTIIPCILGDVKSDNHTDPTHKYHSQDGSVAELIVDYAYFNSSSQYAHYFNGRVQKVVVLDKVIDI